MFSGIKPTGAFPLSGPMSHSAHVPTAEHHKVERESYDQFFRSVQLSGDEARTREVVSQISQRIRIRPVQSELEHLKSQIEDGSYQPDAREIATRMLLICEQEEG